MEQQLLQARQDGAEPHAAIHILRHTQTGQDAGKHRTGAGLNQPSRVRFLFQGD